MMGRMTSARSPRGVGGCQSEGERRHRRSRRPWRNWSRWHGFSNKRRKRECPPKSHACRGRPNKALQRTAGAGAVLGARHGPAAPAAAERSRSAT